LWKLQKKIDKVTSWVTDLSPTKYTAYSRKLCPESAITGIIGKVNIEQQLDATITVFIDLQDQLNMFRASTGSAKQHARKTCLPHQQDIIPYVVKYLSLVLLKMGKNLPEIC
jgi:hypothetical protein